MPKGGGVSDGYGTVGQGTWNMEGQEVKPGELSKLKHSVHVCANGHIYD